MRLNLLAIVGISLISTTVFASEKVGVYLDDTSSNFGESAPAIYTLLKIELEKKGMTVVEDKENGIVFKGIEKLPKTDIEKIYILNILPLGSKFVVGLAERKVPTWEIAFSDRLTASSLEEMDIAIPRLVDAVVEHTPILETQTIESITERESQEWRQKPGMFLWGLGIPCGVTLWSGGSFSYGFGLRLAYEMASGRIDLISIFQGNGKPEKLAYWNFVIEGAYLFLKQNISPFVGGGMGFSTMKIEREKKIEEVDSGVVFNVGGGVEFFRLYKTRLLVDIKLGFPTYKMSGPSVDKWIPILTTMVSFMW